MRKNRKNCGFSLTEVLLAVGTLSIGMIFVAGVFPVAIYFSTEASEQTIAAVVADEAFAKIRLYGVNPAALPSYIQSALFDSDISPLFDPDDEYEFAYPSYPGADILQSRYCWSAICRRHMNTRLVQVTVFVSRRTGANPVYRNPVEPVDGRLPYPMPVEVGIPEVLGSNVLRIEADRETFINDDYIIVDNRTGQLYRVLERRPAPNDNTIVLDRDWTGPAVPTNAVWVVPPPPPPRGGRYPCIAVYQKVIRFEAPQR
jgi:Tfp pilus assembly protein PilV